MAKRRYPLSVEQLAEELQTILDRWIDGVDRRVEDSSDVPADGETWAIISDHGNAELVHRGRNGRLYFHGGLV